LAAELAIHLREGAAQACAHLGGKSTESEIQNASSLNFLAGPHTSSAKDALFRLVTDEGVILPGRKFPPFVAFAHEAVFRKAKFVGIALKLAGAVALTGEAVLRMVREDELEVQPPKVSQPLRIGEHLHAVLSEVVTSGEKPAVGLHKTHAANTCGRKGGVVAKVGDLDARGLRGLKEGSSRGHLHFLSVYL